MCTSCGSQPFPQLSYDWVHIGPLLPSLPDERTARRAQAAVAAALAIHDVDKTLAPGGFVTLMDCGDAADESSGRFTPSLLRRMLAASTAPLATTMANSLHWTRHGYFDGSSRPGHEAAGNADGEGKHELLAGSCAKCVLYWWQKEVPGAY